MENQESFPMTGGDGPTSYARNSNRQKEAAEHVLSILVESVIENLEIEPTSKTFRIADLGCSTGPNTFSAVRTIIEAVTQKYKMAGSNSTLKSEFQVYFADHASNDFNMLFSSLPSDREYFACGVPGSFHGRLFPTASLNFVNCFSALHWLSTTPKDLGNLDSLAFNKGRIFYYNAPDEVGQAYAAQFAKDIQSFLAARAQELAPGGLMSIIIPGRQDGTTFKEGSLGPLFQPLESCLLDMANAGKIEKDKIDLFNLPIYSPSVEELGALIRDNGCFTITRLEASPTEPLALLTANECRSGLESIITKHFGSEIIGELFERYDEKIKAQSLIGRGGLGVALFILLQRKL
ncbi:hypothetical protein SLEP1_g17195 [Rubroshorea leprosula]|uniref:Uncharacterized protein n=1 Tax=Rubroshorea leprosula TaxID=152421 RepID=A0AAV5J553_9ROSI|nr:hypothetical protein SLEP1_g17195 [Rubroshorea leprosula]